MTSKKKCIAMLLAGGQGSRLGVLTQEIAKPAVPFGGKYRIIDFTLSNCVNSGIDTVGVLTQYQPLVLNDYIGNGQPWGLDRNVGGVHILSPYARSQKAEWYKGTANAIYQNIQFIDRYDPDVILILSGDHIYKMDYSKMLRYHETHEAGCTIAVIDVPMEQASRFGIMNATEDGAIYEFEEKPKKPKSTNASMGIYMFDWKILRRYLQEDDANPKSKNDFGKNVIPSMLEGGEKLFAYPFEGYWKDVGTIESLWEANMDLLDPKILSQLSDSYYKIYARNYALPPHYITIEANVRNSMVCEGCFVAGDVHRSVIFTGCHIARNAVIRDSVIMPGAVVEEGAVIQYAIVGENVTVGARSSIGGSPEDSADPSDWGITVIGPGKVLQPGTVIKPKETI